MDSISYIHAAEQQPADESRLFAIDRIGLSAVLGIDVDLVRGPAGAESELDEYTRLCALVDMADAGFVGDADLDLIGGLIDDMTEDDDRRGFEDDEYAATADDLFMTGWAA
ncbi:MULTISPECIES: hypothetical protein [unclassified Streptomyces]|uniref:hypothetical protein n=1 Tax=unclassified Streptomyces TaxID=2593676 RepID=UPI000DC77E4A|nr:MULTISPECIES: hypothetical protein [unclassified Streptomyces]AWZ07712.1 hypothetical protein DRB89_27350 [Streptomyces sp. ICC4]AWZ12643.1 hypothetical protein DRB96_10270 [Streptomyces sp. ICC1]